MTGRLVLAIAVTLTAAAGPAAAQPLFRDERDWTVMGADGRRYGVADLAEVTGGSRVTRVWLGFRVLEPRRPENRWVLDLLPVSALLGVRDGYYWARGLAGR